MEAITITDMAKATDTVMVDMVKATDMGMADTEHLVMEDTDITRADMVTMMDMAKDRAHTVMKTKETRIKMTLLAMITKKMSKTTTDIAMEMVGMVRRADMTMETVDMVTETMDMDMETVDTDMETMDMAMETVIMAMETVIM